MITYTNQLTNTHRINIHLLNINQKKGKKQQYLLAGKYETYKYSLLLNSIFKNYNEL